ncbi:MAG: hypothetical protein OEW24_06410 [Chloroflexota bacterium]|nr:hypothetical protein [Chloroflexota bacterium]
MSSLTSNLPLRRSLIVLAVLASLLGSAVAIRAAAGWTASLALDPPPDPAQLVTDLQNERAHASALSDELAQVLAGAGELRAALEAAQAKAEADAGTATQLAEQLAAAEAKLAQLERQMAAARVATQAAAQVTPASASSVGEPEDEHEGDD